MKTLVRLTFACYLALVTVPFLDAAEKAKVVFISGKPSHGRLKHEHRAGNMILAEALNRSGLPVEGVLVPHYGYPCLLYTSDAADD